ncbi:MAG: hypothetical protein AB7N76_13890 [Planctomycetota bacterium]
MDLPWPSIELGPPDPEDPPRGAQRRWPNGELLVWDGEAWVPCPRPFRGGDAWLELEDEAA